MSRALVVCLTVLCALALLAPTSALAGGPSAGDQQYIDPLAGHHGSGSHHTSTTPAAPAPAPASSPSSGATSPSSSGATSSSSTVSTSGTTTASSTTRGHDPSKGLPNTGFNALQGALVGAVLLAVGKLLGLVARRG
jgi:hypothetical protein